MQTKLTEIIIGRRYLLRTKFVTVIMEHNDMVFYHDDSTYGFDMRNEFEANAVLITETKLSKVLFD